MIFWGVIYFKISLYLIFFCLIVFVLEISIFDKNEWCFKFGKYLSEIKG